MITNEQQLKEVIECIQSTVSNTNLLLFRGENQKYDQMRSGKSRPNAFDLPDIENGWNTIVGRLIKEKDRSTEYKQSILQHYGHPTFYLDLTCDPLVAAWFASYKFTSLEPAKWIGEIGFRLHNRCTYEKISDGIGYLYVLEIPNYKEIIESNLLFEIYNEDLFTRPKKQSAFLMLDKKDTIHDPNNFLIHTIEIDRSQFCSSYNLLDLFPLPNEDKGYSALLDVPFIKNSFCYIPADMPTSRIPNYKTLDYFHSHIKRVIDIPFYLNDITNLYSIKPKTKDITLFEPFLFRNWKRLIGFNLDHYFSISHDVYLSDAVKISLSPTTLNKIQKTDFKVTLQWPEVNSDSLLFIKTEYESDITGHQNSPYLAIWLYKNFDQIIACHIMITKEDQNEIINIEPWNIYIIHENILVLALQESTHPNDKTEDEIKIIESLLRIHGLIEYNEVALLQNPFDIENWHILL